MTTEVEFLEPDTVLKEEPSAPTDDKFCHIRHEPCPSMLAMCGAFKPYYHDKLVEKFRRYGAECAKCNKPLCADCLKMVYTVQTCPNCGKGSHGN